MLREYQKFPVVPNSIVRILKTDTFVVFIRSQLPSPPRCFHESRSVQMKLWHG
ncbi:unnamed protein product [Caenorhabditis brenneri]